jgi:hypothetical protein
METVQNETRTKSVVDKQEHHNHTYEDGLREGRFRRIEEKQDHHESRLDGHAKRLSAQERITYSLLGAIAFIELIPKIQGAIGG